MLPVGTGSPVCVNVAELPIPGEGVPALPEDNGSEPPSVKVSVWAAEDCTTTEELVGVSTVDDGITGVEGIEDCVEECVDADIEEEGEADEAHASAQEVGK